MVVDVRKKRQVNPCCLMKKSGRKTKSNGRKPKLTNKTMTMQNNTLTGGTLVPVTLTHPPTRSSQYRTSCFFFLGSSSRTISAKHGRHILKDLNGQVQCWQGLWICGKWRCIEAWIIRLQLTSGSLWKGCWLCSVTTIIRLSTNGNSSVNVEFPWHLLALKSSLPTMVTWNVLPMVSNDIHSLCQSQTGDWSLTFVVGINGGLEVRTSRDQRDHTFQVSSSYVCSGVWSCLYFYAPQACIWNIMEDALDHKKILIL